MGLMPASYKVTARSVSRVLGDGRRQSDRSLKGHEAGVRKGQPWAVNHHPGIVAVYRHPPKRRLTYTNTHPEIDRSHQELGTRKAAWWQCQLVSAGRRAGRGAAA